MLREVFVLYWDTNNHGDAYDTTVNRIQMLHQLLLQMERQCQFQLLLQMKYLIEYQLLLWIEHPMNHHKIINKQMNIHLKSF